MNWYNPLFEPTPARALSEERESWVETEVRNITQHRIEINLKSRGGTVVRDFHFAMARTSSDPFIRLPGPRE